LAISRLQDAELRFSPIDSLVDAIVGLEALLNTEKSGEVALRIPMNFSTLVEPELKFKHFQELRDLYSLRSKIVHGNSNSDSFKVGEANVTLQEAAQTARHLLRLALHKFVSDPFLRGEEKLNSRVFEERYFSKTDALKR
jgi:Apea-like HEPN